MSVAIVVIVNGAIRLSMKPLAKAVISSSEPQYCTIIGRVVSIDVAPPNAIGAYLLILVVNEIVTMVSSSRRKFTEKLEAPNSTPNSCPTSGPANVYQAETCAYCHTAKNVDAQNVSAN